jgi:hypothetical protein
MSNLLITIVVQNVSWRLRREENGAEIYVSFFSH